MMPAGAYTVGIALYITCIVLFICLTVFAHKKYQERNFLVGICVSFVIMLVFLFIPYISFGYYAAPISLIPGIATGLLIKNIKRGALSGALGILLSWIVFSVIYMFVIFWIFGTYIFAMTVLPSVFCGAIGGAIGGAVGSKRGEKVHQEGGKLNES